MRPPRAAVLVLLVVCGCSGGGKRTPATPAAAPPADASALLVILDPGWGDEESGRAAEQLAPRCLGGAWVARYKRSLGRPPMLALGRVRNRSSEHINTRAIGKQLRTGLDAAAGSRVKLAGEGQAGDLMLLAWLASQDDGTESTTLKAQLLTLRVVDVGSGEVVWSDGFLSRKLITRTPPAKTGDPPGPTQVQRLAPDQTVDLSGLFNDHDARTLARAAVKDLQASTWLKGGGRPVVRLTPLRNRTSEQINGVFISGPLVQALVRHTGARVVTRTDAARHARAQGTAGAGPAAGQQLAATHLITLKLSAASQARRGVSFTSYSLSAAAVSVDDSQTVWSFSRSIQKVVQHAPTGATIK
jgi:hypothetical protein